METGKISFAIHMSEGQQKSRINVACVYKGVYKGLDELILCG